MFEKSGKILGTLLFILLVSGLFYLAFFHGKKTNNGDIRMIEVEGNHLLSAKDYLSFTKLNDNSDFVDLTLPEIKERFLKHPYIKRVELEYEGDHRVKVYITEKDIEATLLTNGEPMLISDDFQVIPTLQDMKILDLPVISNPDFNKKPPLLSYVKNDGVLQAFKIIEAAKLINKDIYKRLSEINLRNGGDIILTFSGVKPPVIYGKGEAAKKMVYLDVMWKSIISGDDIAENSDYIDLRFSGEIFVGTSDKIGLTE